MQIRTRLTVQFTLLVSGILLVAFVNIYYFTYVNTNEDFFARLKSKANSTAELLLKVNRVDTELLKLMDKANRNLIYNENIVIFDEKNRLVYSNTDSLKIQVTNYWLDQVRRYKEINYTEGDYKVIGLYYKYRFNNVVVLQAGQDLYGQANLYNLRSMLITIFVVITAIVAFVGWIFAKRALNPISSVMNEVDRILPDRLGTRLKVPNQNDEIGRLSITFNNLLDRIEHAFRLQKTFVANVSHELKNPLTKISSQLEVSLLKERSVTDYQNTISSVLDDIRELSQLSNSLLELAKVSEERRETLMETTRVDEILWDARMSLLQSNRHYKILLDLQDLPEDDTLLEIPANPSLLKTAFINLMDNACKFSDNTVSVRLKVSTKEIQLQFADNGKGITSDEAKVIFEPFFRSVKTADVKGYGIGLPMVERIVKLHNGSIGFAPNFPSGSVFTVIFPHSK
jgi:signal transduction histidine kinase